MILCLMWALNKRLLQICVKKTTKNKQAELHTVSWKAAAGPTNRNSVWKGGNAFLALIELNLNCGTIRSEHELDTCVLSPRHVLSTPWQRRWTGNPPGAPWHTRPCLRAARRRCPPVPVGWEGVQSEVLKPNQSKKWSQNCSHCFSVWTDCSGSAPNNTCENEPTCRRNTGLLTSSPPHAGC